MAATVVAILLPASTPPVVAQAGRFAAALSFVSPPATTQVDGAATRRQVLPRL